MAFAQGSKTPQIWSVPESKDAMDLLLESKSGDKVLGREFVGRYFLAGYGTPGKEPRYAKPIFWPLNAPGGIPLTRNYPPPEGQAKDHPHQKSAWFCHGDVIPEGIELKQKVKGVEGVDFWSETKGHGVIVCTKAQATIRPPDKEELHGLRTENEWRTADGIKIMDEERTIILYDLGKAHLIVVNIDLHASVCPITFGDTKEGSFGIRINDVINAEVAKKDKPAGKGKIQNADGKIGEKECWGQRSAWCDYSGPIDGKVVGLAILDDPKNIPACWHVRGYGLMAANPFGRDKHAKFPGVKGNNDLVKLAKGEHLRLRYGLLLHTGDAMSGEVAQHYKRFVELRSKE